jgi:hypothetical protein
MHYKMLRSNMFWPYIFGTLVFVLMLASFFIGLRKTGPIVLGTEMNTNGQVEYLCLGKGCESGSIMRWNDKR